MQDIYKGQGLAYIDPHGDSVKKILNLIPKDKIESTIYLDLGDPKWIPSWNPLQLSSLENIGRTADDLVGAIKSIVKGNAWGDRLEHILRNCFYGLLSLPDTTFFDLLIILEQSSKKENSVIICSTVSFIVIELLIVIESFTFFMVGNACISDQANISFTFNITATSLSISSFVL